MLLDMANDGIELPFAGPLKSMVRRFLDAACISDAQCDLYETRAKELVIPELGVSYRHLCQTLGTEWGRACISPDIWIRVWKESVDNAINCGCDVIAVGDVRYANEAQAIREAGGEVWWVNREEAVAAAPAKTLAHASEGELTWRDCDRLIDNNSTLGATYKQVQSAFWALRYAEEGACTEYA
jgi:hypothetical protein